MTDLEHFEFRIVFNRCRDGSKAVKTHRVESAVIVLGPAVHERLHLPFGAGVSRSYAGDVSKARDRDHVPT